MGTYEPDKDLVHKGCWHVNNLFIDDNMIIL